jgi:hypothetical protein
LPGTTSAQKRRAALIRWAHEDGVAGTAKARTAFLARFEREVDPEGVLDPDERERRAARARRVYMADLARKRHQKANMTNGRAPAAVVNESGADPDDGRT